MYVYNVNLSDEDLGEESLCGEIQKCDNKDKEEDHIDDMFSVRSSGFIY